MAMFDILYGFIVLQVLFIYIYTFIVILLILYYTFCFSDGYDHNISQLLSVLIIIRCTAFVVF